MADLVTLTFDVEGFDKSLADWIDRVDTATQDGLRAAGDVVVEGARDSFGNPPGPNSITGTLEDSIEAGDVTGFEAHGYQILIGPSGVDYARKVELRGHPYLKPGLARSTDKARDALVDAWTNAQKG
jgi:hypothetical protein